VATDPRARIDRFMARLTRSMPCCCVQPVPALPAREASPTWLNIQKQVALFNERLAIFRRNFEEMTILMRAIEQRRLAAAGTPHPGISASTSFFSSSSDSCHPK